MRRCSWWTLTIMAKQCRQKESDAGWNQTEQDQSSRRLPGMQQQQRRQQRQHEREHERAEMGPT